MDKIPIKFIMTILTIPALPLLLVGCLQMSPASDTPPETSNMAGPEETPEQYGAIAFSSTTQRWHIRWNVQDPDRAEVLAVKYCGADDCSVILRFGPGQCGTFSLGNDGALSVGLGETKKDTAAKALAGCEASNQQCKVAPVLCNDPTSG